MFNADRFASVVNDWGDFGGGGIETSSGGGYEPIGNFDYVSGDTGDYLAGLGSLSPVAEFVSPYTSIAPEQAVYVAPAINPYEDTTPYTPPAQAQPYEDAAPYTLPVPMLNPYEDNTPYTPPSEAAPYEDVAPTPQPALDIAPPPPAPPAFSDPNMFFNNPPTTTGGLEAIAPPSSGGGTEPVIDRAAIIQAGKDAQDRANAALAAAGQQVKSYDYAGNPFATNTLFGQQATSPIAGTQGKRYAFGGMTDSTPQFNNPFGPRQPTFDPRMYGQGPMQQPAPQQQSVSVGGTPQQPGLPGLLSTASQNQYPQGYTPIGQPQQNFISLGAVRN